jgi:uncharacterized protein
MRRVVIAFSGGVDSTFLAVVARQVLGDQVLAVTAVSPSLPAAELKSARGLAQRLKLRHRVIRSHEMDNPLFIRNLPDRCYHCKKELFGRLATIARRGGYAHVLDGSNADDCGDYRPGRQAAAEFGVRSPLMDLGVTKAEIRAASRAMGLPTADKPAFACLASRFPYGTKLTAPGLRAVDKAEKRLARLGFAQLRVRAHGDIARIELAPDQIGKALLPRIRQRMVQIAKEAGFRYVALDLQGYRTGSLNEILQSR